MPTVEQVKQALSKVNDPELQRDLVSLGMVKQVQVDGSKVAVEIELTTPACPMRSKIETDCREAIEAVEGVEQVEVQMSARTRGSKGAGKAAQDLLPEVKNVIIVASGKGGVGKSSVAINIAATLARRGARTGLMDADFYGPSIPTMMGVTQPPEVFEEGEVRYMVPVEAHGVHLMSIGFFVDPAQAVGWRGPMLHKALEQFLTDVRWGEMDYLVVDVPPGTGDVHMSLASFIRATGAVLVSTPQRVALADVVRGRSMFNKLDTPVLGLVENMSYFVCDGCGKEHDIFARGGGARAAEKLEIDFFGEIPLIPDIRITCDEGVPVVVKDPEGPAARAYDAVVDRLVESISRRAVEGEGEGADEPKLKLV